MKKHPLFQQKNAENEDISPKQAREFESPLSGDYNGIEEFLADASANMYEEQNGVANECSIPDEELVALCRERFCSVCPVKKEADDAQLRAMAELANVRKRLEREKEVQGQFAAESVLKDIIPTLDNLNLALLHAPKSEESKNFVVGVQMTKHQMLESLKKHGFEEVGAVGDAFDPAQHEAVAMENNPNVPDNHICALVSNGYMLHGRLLRSAKVMVSQHK